VRVHARHPVLRHLGELEVREKRQLGEQYRIEIRILRRSAAVGVEKRERFVEVVHDRRVRRKVPLGQRAHRHLRQIDVAIVVVIHVLSPVRHTGATPAAATWRRRILLRFLLRPVEPIHVAIASVRIRNGRHRYDHVVANLGNQRGRFRREPVDQLHQHLGGTGFAAVKPSHEVVVRPGRGNQLFDLIRRQPARVGNLREVVAIALQAGHVLVGRHPHDDQLAILVGFADRFHCHARRRGRERTVVPEDVGVVGQLARRANVIAENVLRHRYTRDARQVIHERADEIRLRRPLLDGPGEILVLRLRGVACLGDRLLGGNRHRREKHGGTNEKRQPAGMFGKRHFHRQLLGCGDSTLFEMRSIPVPGRARTGTMVRQ
jgi:hypothetical protein